MRVSELSSLIVHQFAYYFPLYTSPYVLQELNNRLSHLQETFQRQKNIFSPSYGR